VLNFCSKSKRCCTDNDKDMGRERTISETLCSVSIHCIDSFYATKYESMDTVSVQCGGGSGGGTGCIHVNRNTTTKTNVARITTGVRKGPYPRLCAQSSLGNALARITTGTCKGPHPRLCAQFPLCTGQNHKRQSCTDNDTDMGPKGATSETLCSVFSRGNNVARITTRICKGPYPRLCAQFHLPLANAFHQLERYCTDNDTDMQGPYPRLCAQHSCWLTQTVFFAKRTRATAIRETPGDGTGCILI